MEKIHAPEDEPASLMETIEKLMSKVMMRENREVVISYLNKKSEFERELDEAMKAAGYPVSSKKSVPEWHEIHGSTFPGEDGVDQISSEARKFILEMIEKEFVRKFISGHDLDINI